MGRRNEAVADHGVAVIGNGPVGQTVALLLARRGVPVVVLDARPARDAVGSKAICQQRDVLDVWEWVGVGRRIADEGVTWRTARTFHHDAELFAYDLADAGASEFPPFVNISQTRVEQLLDERIAAEPLVETRWGHEVTDLSQDGDGVSLTCADGTRVAAAYVVACAGARGEVIRSALGVTFEGRSFDDRFLICDIRADLPGWADERRFYFDPAWNPGRQVLIHPCPGGTFRIDWQVPAGYDLGDEEATGGLDARIRAIVGDVDYEVVWKSVYRFQSRIADRMRVGRVLLAGDCAHLYSPFGARGLNSGVGDADNAAWKLAWVLRGWAGERLVESYHDERHAAARENLAVTSATMDFLVPHGVQQHRKRRAVLKGAATDPQLRAQVDSGRLAEPFWYVDSPLTTTDPTRPFGGRPPRATVSSPGPGVPSPGPGVLVPDVPVPAGHGGRLRELARGGFLVLVAEGADRGERLPQLPWPTTVHAMSELDPTGGLAVELGVRPGEWWVLRPDAYIAGIAGDAAAAADVLRRAAGDVGARAVEVDARAVEVDVAPEADRS